MSIDRDFVPVQTSVPDWLMTYNRQLADVHYSRRLNRMYVHMLQGFLAYEPWKADPPLEWRVARTHMRQGANLGWVPMNMSLPTALYDQMKSTIDNINVNGTDLKKQLSIRTFLYTVVVWWVTCVYPYTGPGMLEN